MNIIIDEIANVLYVEREGIYVYFNKARTAMDGCRW
jgi:hypothetical protein